MAGVVDVVKKVVRKGIGYGLEAGGSAVGSTRSKKERIMADFGNAGTRTVRQHVRAVQVNKSNGEYLLYKLTALGATPIFTFACTHRSLRSESDFPDHPKSEYEWTWSKNPTDSDAADDVYGVAISFLTATKYTLVVEHRRGDNSVIQILKDIDYESQDPNDTFRETLRVLLS